MSLETTSARIAANQARDAWRTHWTHCPRCQRRAPGCADGQFLYTEHRESREELARQMDLDARPIPGQQTLF